MAVKLLILCWLHLMTSNAQYYSAVAPSYPPYSYNYYSPQMSAAPTFGQTYPNTPPVPTIVPAYLNIPPTPFEPTYPNIVPSPSFGLTYPNIAPTQQLPLKTPKRSISTPPCPKCSPPTASAYFMSTPSENIKATVLAKDKIQKSISPPPSYSCPLCNNFADVPLNSKIPPPPPIGSPVLPGILDEVPTIIIPKDLALQDPSSIISPKMPLFSDMYEKHKLPKNLTFDQELLEGFLTGLGITE